VRESEYRLHPYDLGAGMASPATVHSAGQWPGENAAGNLREEETHPLVERSFFG